ncbi:MAG: hypothetical protein GYB67_15145 [Chloroflexi bacterium]|nr:hypothetical protein [Chloroflexota bacterium]
MSSAVLPSNDDLIAYSSVVPWQEIERQKRHFRTLLKQLIADDPHQPLPLDMISQKIGAPVTWHDPDADADSGNVLLAHIDSRHYVLGSMVSSRYRSGKSLLESIGSYNLNPSINHSNLHQTEDSVTQMRVLGAEIEVGLIFRDGSAPSEDEIQKYIHAYDRHARRIGVYPHLDREACQYQVEAHIAPNIGYAKTRSALNGMMQTFIAASEETGMIPLLLSAFPTLSDFKMAEYPKVQTAVDLMLEVNGLFPHYGEQLAAMHKRYHVDPPGHYVNMFRNMGCHIHIDVAGRSEALGLLTYHTVLKSATAVANAAVLKGGPFVNGTCDAELLCTREMLRRVTVTGTHLDLPLSPHLMPDGLDQYATLLKLERANATGRAMMYDDSLGHPISLMHNPIGRLRPDLGSSKGVCTVESTGMSNNVSTARMAAVLADFEFSHALMEAYFRKHGLDLEPMYDDRILWDLLGPLDRTSFTAQQDRSDRHGTDVVVKTASGSEMALAEFYEIKRRYMHVALDDVPNVAPREIDDVYTIFQRMLNPLTGQHAQTIEQYILDPKRRSTGNWGRILRNAYIEAGGVLGAHHPDAVLAVVNQIYDALRERYL